MIDLVKPYTNFPDPQWKGVSTFPEHFHDGTQKQVHESRISNDPLQAIHQFMDFIKNNLS